MSREHAVEIVRLGQVRHHDNADALDITDIRGGYPCIVKRDSFSEGDLAVYVPIDSLVDTSRPEFAFLTPHAKADGLARIKAVRLRGVFSMGLLVPAPVGAVEGDDVAARLGVTVYVQPDDFTANDALRDNGCMPVYSDIESWRRFRDVLRSDEEVVVLEKLHGQNARLTMHEGELFVGSRTNLKKRDENNVWWRAMMRCPEVVRLVEAQLDLVVYGEQLGTTGGYPYGPTQGVAHFAAFDMLTKSTRRYLDWPTTEMLLGWYGVPSAPVLFRGSARDADIEGLAEGETALGGGRHVREGVVIRPLRERFDERLGRVILKLHGQGHLLRRKEIQK